MAKETKELVTASAEDQFLTNIGLDEDQFLQELNDSSSDFGASDITIPFLRVLQQLSPQVTKGRPNYIPGAEAGNFINTASQQVFDGEKGVLVIPCRFQNRYLEWRPRTMGGGLVRDFGEDASAALGRVALTGEKGQQLTAEGHEIVRSLQYWALTIDEDTGIPEQVVLSLASTQSKKAKDWNYVIANRKEVIKGGLRPMASMPHFYTYRLTTQLESNDRGSWYGIKVQPAGRTADLPTGRDVWTLAQSFREMISTGKVRAAAEHDEAHDDTQASPF